MKTPEKNTERFGITIIRSAFTSAIIATILVFAHVLPGYGMSKPALFGTVWLMIFCIVFGGHYLEVLFINYLKFMLPANIALLYLVRLVYWFLCAIPLYVLANHAGSLVEGHVICFGNWWQFGLLYIGIELFMHAIMHLRWKKSFYNGVY